MKSLTERGMRPLNLAKQKFLFDFKKHGQDKVVKKSDKGKPAVEKNLPKGFFEWYY